jgi:murein DD-endopeptidase MepM/ murein hydrolase activator NlpD
MKGRIVGLLVVAIAGALTGYLVTRLEGDAPGILTNPGPLWVGNSTTVDVRITDQGTGVRAVHVWLELEDGTEIPLLDQEFAGDLLRGAALDVEQELEVVMRPAELEVGDGEATLYVEATDYSWRANRTVAQVPIRIDTAPPRIAVTSGLTYVRRGGAELAMYRIGEGTTRHGVRVGDSFSPGFRHPSDPGQFVAFYAVQPDSPADLRVEVVAEDRAGNEAVVPLAVSLVERSFPSDTVQVSDGFLERKIPELLPEHEGDLLDAYLKVNRDLRRENAQKLRTICSDSSDDRLWSGPFLQLPSSQVNARFAERRTYVYEGREVDQQTHLGFDLASTAHAPVPAANDGVVAFAGPLGIYGNTVVIDHGLGVFSLYGHLSEVTVEKGQPVARGDRIGRTGATGLAGGDHLHFSMLVAGDFVDPLEWFDEQWIEEHVEAKLGTPRKPEAQEGT